jgi:hypothetical protein
LAKSLHTNEFRIITEGQRALGVHIFVDGIFQPMRGFPTEEAAGLDRRIERHLDEDASASLDGKEA